MPVATFTPKLFDRALTKLFDGTLDLDTQAIKAVLTTTTQALDRSFTGSSGDARYADLTAELTTGSGYTAGGVALSGVALSRVTTTVANDTVKFSASAVNWTFSGALALRYLVLYVDGATNKDLLLVGDLTGSGNLTISPGAVQWAPNASGIFTGVQS